MGLGRDAHYPQFQVPREHRVRRFREQVELIRALWTESKVSYKGKIYQLEAGAMSPRPVQKPHPPIWFGGGHPDAIRRAAEMADGWMGAGGSTNADFKRSVPLLREHLEKARRDPKTFPISKRVFLSVHERAESARQELHRWYSVVYHNPPGTDTSGVHGTPERPRLSVFRSLKHIYAQVIDDVTHQTLVAASDLDETIKGDLGGLKKKDRAKKIGAAVAKRCIEKGITQVVFDRNGFIYHGRVAAVADGAREAGLKF